MCLVGALPWLRGALLTLSQILGGIISAAIVSVLFPGPLNVRTSLSPTATIAQGLFIEMFLTTQLIFTIFMLAAEKHKGTFIAPIGIGLSLFIAELTGVQEDPTLSVKHITDLRLGVYYTGGSLNPARSFGPSAVLRSFYHYDWVGLFTPSRPSADRIRRSTGLAQCSVLYLHLASTSSSRYSSTRRQIQVRTSMNGNETSSILRKVPTDPS